MAYTTPQIRLLIAREAHRQGIDPRLALAVATQESSLDPGKVGDNGKSLGLFQLQRAAAIDAGIDPTRRGEIGLNVQGGVAYLKQKLQQSGGNVEQALSRYNRGTPTYRGIGDPRYIENVLSHYRRQTPERPGFLRQMARAVTPASAEAAPPMPVPRGEQESARSEAPMASQIELRDR
jgi:soluble lytic murein transglycosylase-like protein